MHVGDGGHSVGLEVLVGAEAGRFLNRAPVREAGLRVVEPLVAQILHVIGVTVADAFSDLGAGHPPVEIEHLRPDLLHHVGGALDAHQLVPKDVARTDNFMLADVLTVERRHGHAAIVHLTSENLIAKQPIAENATVTVGAVKAFSSSDIWEVT